MTTDLSATLTGIKEHHRQHVSANFPEPGICVSRCPEKWPCEPYRALAAIEKVLELHRPVDRGRVMNCCEGCEAVNGDWHEDCCHEWPCPTVEAITAELTGKETGDETAGT